MESENIHPNIVKSETENFDDELMMNNNRLINN